ncbi:MAG TPA: phosphate signaling complex protein PhoU [Longimicrobiales bacterium]|nr:phosphate signaling complex protein PhoU [Longimicrobiales bacterium]
MKPQMHFREELERLKSSLVGMSAHTEEAVRNAVGAFLDRDEARAQAVIDGDPEIDKMEMEIDERVIQLLALQQPLASDLRFITMAMKISNDLERMGDHAVNIAKEVKRLLQHPRLGALPEIEEMVTVATKMLTDALDAFIRRDAALAREVIDRDDRVDDLHSNVFRILLTQMMENPRNIGPCMETLLVSRNLERIADLTTNIAEDLVFMVEARVIKHGVDKRI